jgi:hypothetical protein
MWAARIALRFVGRWRVGISWVCALMIVFMVTVFDSRFMRAEDAPGADLFGLPPANCVRRLRGGSLENLGSKCEQACSECGTGLAQL